MSGLTPMMKQYNEIHNTVRDCILFYRLGDFYEMFFDDAIKVSRELDITLTGKNCGLEQKAPMCGVPYHSAEGYIAKLVEKGYKVAICEQVEEASQAKGLVKREVVRIVSAGTIISEKSTNNKDNNYLMSVYYNMNEIGVSYCDISTGEFYTLELNSGSKVSEFLSVVSRVNPSEIIASSIFCENETLLKEVYKIIDFKVQPYPKEYFSYQKSEEIIKDHFKIFSLSGIGLDSSKASLRASGALLRYLEETQKNALIHINKISNYSAKDYMHLDHSTKSNLELFKNLKTKEKKDSLLWVIDKTTTAMGSRNLKKWLSEPLINKEEILKRQEGVHALSSDVMILEDIIEKLKDVKDIQRILSKLCMDKATPRDLLSLRDSILNIPKIKLLLSKVYEDSILLKELFEQLDSLIDIYDLIYLAVDEECQINLKKGGIIKKGYREEIDKLNNLKNNSNEILAEMELREKEKTGIKNLKIRYNKVFGYFFDVTSSYEHLVPDYFIRKQTLANSERFFTDELKKLEEELLSVEEKLIKEEYQAFVHIKDIILQSILRIQKTAAALGVLDTICSFGISARKNNYVRPIINDEGIIEIEEGRHPVVEMITKQSNFIHNDTLLDLEENRMMIITGANMAGKSTYIRQVAIMSIMMQIGSFVPASRANMSIVDRVFTRVGASDDLASGQSTFMVEMSEVSNILKFATKNSLIILDEVGRGTSTFDGLSIAHAVIDYILDKEIIGAKTLFATHYHELTALEEGSRGIKNYSITIKSSGDDVIFLRKIQRGASDKSYGIEVAKLAGLPSRVIEKSNEILKVLEVNEKEYKNKLLNNIKSSKVIKGQESIFEDKNVKKVNPIHEKVLKDIKDLPIDEMSPMESMSYLYQLKNKLKENDE